MNTSKYITFKRGIYGKRLLNSFFSIRQSNYPSFICYEYFLKFKGHAFQIFYVGNKVAIYSYLNLLLKNEKNVGQFARFRNL